MNEKKLSRLLPIVFFICVYIIPLAWRPMITPDEFRYGEIPRTMLHTGEFISPHLLNVRYFEKPVFGYYMTAATMAVFGENAFAVRLPSALSVGLTALLIFWLVKKIFDDEPLASLATMLYMTCGMVFGIGTFAVLDSQTTLFVTGTIIPFYLAIQATSKKSWAALLALAGVSCGLAFLTKGFLAFAVPALTIVPYLIWSKKFKSFLTTPWIPLVCILIVVLPWAIAIHIKEPKFWHYFFWIEHIQRFTTESEGQHAEPFWFLIPPMLGGIFPGALVALGAFITLEMKFKAMLKDDFCRFLICYLVLPFIFFSASTGKLATYILPCFPPAAILLAIGLKKYIEDNRQHKTLDWTLIILPWVLIAGAAGFTIVQILMYFDLIPTLFTKNEWYKWVIAGVAVIFWCWMILKNRNADVKKKIIAFFAGMIPVLMAGQMAFPEHVLHGKIQEAPLQRLTAYIPENSQILVQHNVMHAVSWVTQRDDLDFFLTAGELNHSVQEDYPDEYGERLYGLGQFRKWVKSPERTRPLVVICRIRKEKFDKDYNHYFKDVEEYIKAQYYDEEIYMVVF